MFLLLERNRILYYNLWKQKEFAIQRIEEYITQFDSGNIASINEDDSIYIRCSGKNFDDINFQYVITELKRFPLVTKSLDRNPQIRIFITGTSISYESIKYLLKQEMEYSFEQIEIGNEIVFTDENINDIELLLRYYVTYCLYIHADISQKNKEYLEDLQRHNMEWIKNKGREIGKIELLNEE